MKQNPTIVRVARLPELPVEGRDGVEVWRDTDGTPCAYGQIMLGEHWMHLPGLASFRFGADSDDVTALVPPSTSLETVADAYRRAVLPIALHVWGREVLHASAVLVRGRVVAFCAVSGTGKSTLAGGLSRRGHSLWGDDAVTFDVTGPVTEAISVPFTLRLDNRASSFLGGNGAPPASVARAPLGALFLLTRGEEDDEVEIAQCTPAEAFPALLVHAYCFTLEGEERKRLMLEQYLALAERVPTFSVRFPPGFTHFSELLDRIEETLESKTGAAL